MRRMRRGAFHYWFAGESHLEYNAACLMNWIAPSEKDADATPEKRPCDTADQFSANSGLRSEESSGGRLLDPVPSLAIQRFTEARFAAQRKKLPFNLNAMGTAIRANARRQSASTQQDFPESQDHEQLKESVGSGRRLPSNQPLPL